MTSILSFDRRVFAATAILLASCGSEAPHVTTQTVTASVEVVKSATLPETRITTGTVRSTTVSPLAARVTGNVTRVLVSEGQHVRAGDLLVEIDDREGRAKTAQATAGGNAVDEAIAGASAAVSGAEANAALAGATYKRFAALRARASVSAQEFEEVAARKAGADAQLNQAKRSRDALLAQRAQAHAGLSEAETFLSYSQVRSPIAGVVTARMIDPGAQAAPGMPLLTVEDDSHYRVETTIDEELAGSVHAGDSVTIDGTSRAITARITNVVPVVDPGTRSALVKIDLPFDSGFRSGAFVRVVLVTGSRKGITVPASAITQRGQLASVFVVEKDIARMRLVTLGDPQGQRVEVLSGIDPGETIVTRISNDIRDGVRVVSSGIAAMAPVSFLRRSNPLSIAGNDPADFARRFHRAPSPRRSGEKVAEGRMRGLSRLQQGPLIPASRTFSPLRRGEGAQREDSASHQRITTAGGAPRRFPARNDRSSHSLLRGALAAPMLEMTLATAAGDRS